MQEPKKHIFPSFSALYKKNKASLWRSQWETAQARLLLRKFSNKKMVMTKTDKPADAVSARSAIVDAFDAYLAAAADDLTKGITDNVHYVK